MNVKQIIKSLECCKKLEEDGRLKHCMGCLASFLDEDECKINLFNLVLNLIKVQQAEIERLKQLPTHITVDKTAFEECCYNIETAKAEAYQEFAERLKSKAAYCSADKGEIILLEEDFVNTLEELTEEKDGEKN